MYISIISTQKYILYNVGKLYSSRQTKTYKATPLKYMK